MSNGKTRAMTFGVIVGNRGFFPGHLAKSGRADMIAVIEKAGHKAVLTALEETKHGAIETRAEAAKCADVFKRHRDSIDGIIVTLPNFGDERAIANTLRMAGLNVPVLIQATPDTPGLMTIADRRDSFAARCRPAIICASSASRTPLPRSTRKRRIPPFSRKIWNGSRPSAAW